MDFTLEDDSLPEKGHSQSFDSPNTGKAKKAQEYLSTFTSKWDIPKLKASVSERRYINFGDDDLRIERNASEHPPTDLHLPAYKMYKGGEDRDLKDPRIDSFEDFLKTNNYLDYSMNGLFEEANNTSKKEISSFEPPFKADKAAFEQKELKNKLEFSVVAQASHISLKPSPLSILNKFQGSEKVLCGATINQNFKKNKLAKNSVITAAAKQKENSAKETPGGKKYFQSQHYPSKEKISGDFGVHERKSVCSKDHKHNYERSISSLASGSRMAAVNVDDFLKQNVLDESYRYVDESYPDGSRYEGYMLHGKRHGHGKLEISDKSRYEGDWKQNMMSGIGKLTYQDGSLAYEGGFLDNKIHGHGIMINREAGMLLPKTPIDFRNFATVNKWWATFEGIFNNGVKEGVGTWTFTTGEVFTGNFTQDMVSGVGRFYSGDRVIIGIWFNNIFIKHLN